MAKKKRRKAPKGKTRGEATYEWLVAKGKEFSEDLLNKLTPYERMLKEKLTLLGYKFEMQVPIICAKKNLFIVDFLLIDFNIFIEADGVSTHGTKETMRKDNLRTKKLIKEGYYPLRFWNKQIEAFSKEQIDQIIQLKVLLLKSANVNTSK